MYLADVKDRFPKSLGLQCVPEDPALWEIENYEAFLQNRRVTLASHLNAFLKGITDTKPPEAAITLEELIAEGEDDELEFKSSLRWDFRELTPSKKLEEVIVKTVAAFANSQGGTLLIGVSDSGEILGLEADYLSLEGANRDKFELHLRTLLSNAFGTAFVSSKLKVLFPTVGDVEICQVDIQPSANPLVLEVKDKHGVRQEKFYVRSGNSSQELSVAEMLPYLAERFQK
jgi:predicted HTH transcriptional regulator